MNDNYLHQNRPDAKDLAGHSGDTFVLHKSAGTCKIFETNLHFCDCRVEYPRYTWQRFGRNDILRLQVQVVDYYTDDDWENKIGLA